MPTNSDVKAAHVLLRCGNHILVARKHGKAQFQPLGGKLERGEDPDACLARECREEAGFDVGAFVDGGFVYDSNCKSAFYSATCEQRPHVRAGREVEEVLWVTPAEAAENADFVLGKILRTVGGTKRAGSHSKAASNVYHNLVFLRNHRNPPVLFLAQRGSALSIVASDKYDRFSVGGADVLIAGAGRAAGVELVASAQQDGVVQQLVCVDTPDVLPKSDAHLWLPRQFEHGLYRQRNKTPELDGAWSAFEQQIIGAPTGADTIVADRMPRYTEKVVVQGCEVPALNPHIKTGEVLQLIAPCSGGKSWRLREWLKMMQDLDPRFCFMSIGVRITHCVDQHSAMRGDGIVCDLYCDPAPVGEGQATRGVVVQLQSILRYSILPDFTAVVLDEICSLLAYFQTGNNGMFRTASGRKSMLPYLAEVERRCKGAAYLIVADADILMDQKVQHFLEGVRRGSTVNTLIVAEHKPFLRRALRMIYPLHGGDPMQNIECGEELRAAIAGVQADPNERIFIACNAAKLATQQNRAQTGSPSTGPSYYDFCLEHGIRRREILVVHGDVGHEEKTDIFQNLTARLQRVKVLICTTAVTVGIDIAVVFGHVFAHSNRNCGVVRDLFQLIPRVGRFEGGLMASQPVHVPSDATPGQIVAVKPPFGDPMDVALPAGAVPGGEARVAVPNLVVYMTVHSQSAEKRRADRSMRRLAGDDVPAKKTFASALGDVQTELKTRQSYNRKATKASTVSVVPEWAVRVEADNRLEKAHSEAFHVEEVLRYAEHRGFTVTLAKHPDSSTEADTSAPITGSWEHCIDGNSRVAAVRETLRAAAAGAESDAANDLQQFLLALQSGSSFADDAGPGTSMHVVATDVFWKAMLPYGYDPVTDANALSSEEIDLLWSSSQLAKIVSQTYQRTHEIASRVDGEATKALDNDGAVDPTVRLPTQRAEGAQMLAKLLGVESLVAQRVFVPAELRARMQAQYDSEDKVGGDFDAFYKAFKMIGVRGLVMPGVAKPRKRGSKFHEDLRSAMRLLGMEEFLSSAHSEAWQHAGRGPDGKQRKVLHPQYSFSPLPVVGKPCASCQQCWMLDRVAEGEPKYVRFDPATSVYTDQPCSADCRYVAENPSCVTSPYFKPTLARFCATSQRLFELCQKRLMPLPAKDARVPLCEYERAVRDMEDALSEDDSYVQTLELGVCAPATALPGQYVETVSIRRAKLLLHNLQHGLQDERLGLDVVRAQDGETKRQVMARDCRRLILLQDDADEDLARSTVAYEYKYAQLGRRYAIGGGSATLQSVAGTVRKTVCEDLYYDLDFVNCFNVILFAAALHWQWPEEIVSLLRAVVQQRDRVHDELMGYYGCTEGAAKVLVIKHWGGGKVGAWLRDASNKISTEVLAKIGAHGHHRVVCDLERLAPKVCDLFLDRFPEMRAMVQDVNRLRAREGKAPKTEYTALHYGLQTVEDKLLSALETFLERRNYTVGSLQYDGLYVHRGGADGGFPAATLREAEAFLARQDVGGGLTVPMRLKEKGVRCPYQLRDA
eukprot:COSAG04_NODE_651_length_11559_cov_6.052880_8_plen_1525_part_00